MRSMRRRIVVLVLAAMAGTGVWLAGPGSAGPGKPGHNWPPVRQEADQPPPGMSARPPAPPTPRPPMPEWVRPDGSVDAARLPKELPLLDRNGNIQRDANGNVVTVSIGGPPPGPPANLLQQGPSPSGN